MRDQLRILGVSLLASLLGLLAGVLLLVALWFTFPAYLDIQAGRVTFAEASNHIWLGVGAGVGIFAIVLALIYLKAVDRRVRLMAQYNLKAHVKDNLARKTATRSKRAVVTENAASWAGNATGKIVYPPYWPELRQLVLDRDHNRCGNCGSSEDLHVHHIVPLSRGGSNEMGNLRTLCKRCHQRLHPHMR